MSANTFHKISAILPSVKYRVKDGTSMEATYVVEVANNVLRNVYDEEVWDLVRVVYFRSGVLTLQVSASVVGHAIKMKEKLFCECVERQTGIAVRSLVCRVGV